MAAKTIITRFSPDAPISIGEPPRFYECGICGAMHSADWDGDCRQDDARFDVEMLDERYGINGWTEVDMPI